MLSFRSSLLSCYGFNVQPRRRVHRFLYERASTPPTTKCFTDCPQICIQTNWAKEKVPDGRHGSFYPHKVESICFTHTHTCISKGSQKKDFRETTFQQQSSIDGFQFMGYIWFLLSFSRKVLTWINSDFN